MLLNNSLVSKAITVNNAKYNSEVLFYKYLFAKWKYDHGYKLHSTHQLFNSNEAAISTEIKCTGSFDLFFALLDMLACVNV